MKTPTLEEVKEYFKNAKEVKCLFTEKIYDILKAIIREDNKNQFEAYFEKENDYCRLYKFGNYAEIISYIEPTTKVRNSVLLQLADNNSYSEEILKKECPKLFESEIKLNNWYKSKHHPSMLIYPTSIEEPNNSLYGYGFNSDGLFRVYDKDTSNHCLCNDVASKHLYLATPQEVETALTQEFEKQNNVKLNERKPLEWSFENVTYSLSFRNLSNVRYCKKTNSLYFGGGLLFRDGKFAKIIETPTDIITIVEKYGKDKVISLIEKM